MLCRQDTECWLKINSMACYTADMLDTECWLKINSMACYADKILNVG